MPRHTPILALVSTLVLATVASAQQPPDAGPRLAAQRAAMKQLAKLDGVWVGTAYTTLPSGERHEIVQTERVGTFLDGTIRVVEGRGYEKDGSVAFNAFGIISYEPSRKAYTMRSYAMGRSGDYPLRVTDAGFTWEIPAGPMTITYTATIDGDTWREVGERIMPGRDPIRFFEMTLTRRGDTQWPAGGAIGPDGVEMAARGTVLRDTVVEASCGQCQLGLAGSGCDLAVRIDGIAYFVEGTGIDDHGDAHGEDGFCNAVRHARVNGRIEGDRFVVTSFELLSSDRHHRR